jgi:UDP-N-acetylglucosamine--N-acetylmuramyl-(pentapeptide) pyrophosphoryl-undecaprenol N-acetylglucosamine transferase
MPAGLAAADLVVCRAGAMTLAELATAGRPAILIPSPHVTHHHQEANARVFARAGAAQVLPEDGLTGRRLQAAIAGLLGEPARLRAMAEGARGMARPQALDDIVALVEAAGRRRSRGRSFRTPA